MSSFGPGFNYRQGFPCDERGYPAFEPAQIIVVHDIEQILYPAEMLTGPVQGGVCGDDFYGVLSQKPFADALRISDGNRKPRRVDRKEHAHRLHHSADGLTTQLDFETLAS
jgi:hypothetical protein